MSNVRQWLESTRQNGMSLDLKSTIQMIERLDINFDSMKVIHVAGSNGKGSACALMAASLTLSGITNLMFSSPHISRVEERVRLNCAPIDKTLFESALQEIYNSSLERNGEEKIILTFFEVTFLISLLCAKYSKIEILILETGLGGRLDATRCVPADACLLTSITREHSDILGQNIEQIIAEKAAIARPDKPIIAREMKVERYRDTVQYQVDNAGNKEIGEISKPAHVKFIHIPEGYTVKQETELLVNELFNSIDLPTSYIELANRKLSWPARLQLITSKSNKYLLDAAHNPSGLARVLPELSKIILENSSNWVLLFGTSPQTEMDKMIDLIFDLCNRNPPKLVCLTKPHGGRYPGVETKFLSRYKWPIEDVLEFENASDSLEFLTEQAPKNFDLIVSIGSLYLQGNILHELGLDGDEHLSILPKQS